MTHTIRKITKPRADVAADAAAYDAHLAKMAEAKRFAHVGAVAKAIPPVPPEDPEANIMRLQDEVDEDIAKLSSTAKLSRSEATAVYLKTPEGREKYNRLDKQRELAGIYKQRTPQAPAPDAPIAKSANEQKLDTLIAKHAADHKVSRPAATAAVLKTPEGRQLYAEANVPGGAR